MDVNNRIEKIKPYFVTFNVNDGIAYVLVKFPKKWSLFNKVEIEHTFNINIAQKEEGVYFLCEITSGFDSIFDGVDYIITNNIALEEKTNLLEVKVKELSELFMTEPLEKLKTIQFVFQKKSTAKTKKSIVNKTVESTEVKFEEAIAEPIVCTQREYIPQTEEDAVQIIENKPKQTGKKNKNKQSATTVEDSSLMDFAKTMIEG